MTKNIWLIGSAAGLATVLLFLSSGFAAGGGILGFFVPLPSLIAGLAYGWPVAGIAGLAGAIFFFALTNGAGGIVYGVIVAVPATLLVHQAGLWQPNANARFIDSFRQPPPMGQSENVTWFPLSGILMWLMLLATALATLMTFSLGIDDLTYKAAVHEVMEELIDTRMQPFLQREFTIEERASLKESTAALLPGLVASSWMFLMILNTWLAAKIARASSLMQRPAPDMRMTGLPRGVIFGLGIMLFAASFGGLVARFATGFAGASIFAILLIGLAVLHEWSLGRAGRPILLSGAYAGILLAAVLAVPLLLALGIADRFLDIRGKARARRLGHSGGRPPKVPPNPPD